jgi:hypothetical protein
MDRIKQGITDPSMIVREMQTCIRIWCLTPTNGLSEYICGIIKAGSDNVSFVESWKILINM